MGVHAVSSVTDQLEKLVQMHKDGFLTRSQFEAQRDQLLEGPGDPAPPAAPPAPKPRSSDLTDQVILEYRLQRKLGEGGMGSVYLAAHETLNQRVAVKVLADTLARDPEIRTRFIQEANIQISLHHPGIVRVLTANTRGEHLALVMEYVEGMSLDQALQRHGPLPLDKTLHLMKQVLEAVGYAHGEGVVHRDLKPSNIMVQPDGKARVMDFGIAKVLGGGKLTRTGTLMGTAHYMSPEQVLGRADIDHRTDIYSLGVTFYEALTGSPPFEAVTGDNPDSDFLIKQAHIQTSPPDPRGQRPDLPESLARALLRSMQKDVTHRFASCDEFVAAVAGAESGLGAPPGPAAPPPTPTPGPGAPSPPRPTPVPTQRPTPTPGPPAPATDSGTSALCASCQGWVGPHDMYCPWCGQPQQTFVLCPSCNNPVGDRDRFCMGCGNALATAQERPTNR